jgi:tetratricopeptide (TPR) repeat protein
MNNELLSAAYTAAKIGYRDQVLNLLRQLLMQDIRNEEAWILLSEQLEDPDKVIYCLEKALIINPENGSARARLESYRSNTQFILQSEMPDMSSQSNQMQAIIGERNCPFVGMREDPETLAAYPSMMNLCLHQKPHKQVDFSHQAKFCLSESHVNCPVYIGEMELITTSSTLDGSINRKLPHFGLLAKARVWGLIILVGVILAGIYALLRLP